MANDTYLIDHVQFGLEGLDLHRSDERISKTKLGRMVNVHRPVEGYLTTRPGQVRLGQVSPAPAGRQGSVHSIRRLNSPKAGTFTRVWGVGESLYTGAAGDLTLVDSGYSGEPLHLVRHRPTTSGESWMFVGDKRRMRKVRSDGLVVPIGLPAPQTPPTPVLVSRQRTVVDLFQSDAGWIDVSNVGPFSLGGTHRIVNGPSGIANAVQFRLPSHGLSPDPPPLPDVPTSWMWWVKPLSLNLNTVGSRAAEDADLFHVYISVTNMPRLVDIRLYFVLNSPLGTGQFSLPGANIISGVGNAEAYMKVFRKHDFENAVQVKLGRTPDEVTADTSGRLGAEEDVGREEGEEFRLTSREVTIRREQYEGARQVPKELQLGALSWSEFGVVDAPLRRGDFIRIGGDVNLDWSNVTGLVVQIQSEVSDAFGASSAMDVSFSDLFLHGGYDIDNADPGDDHYDWRYTYFDTRTGAESNPSPVMDDDDKVDTARRGVRLDPQGYRDETGFLDPAVLQRFYRRGGSNVSDWRFVGTNPENGEFFTDEASDASIIASAPVDLDNDQPVTTLDVAGDTIRDQPVSVIIGPVSDILLALGDPERPGHLYWSKPGEPDHWPPQNNVEVCGPSEELMTGVVFGDLAYIFSREKMYRVIPSLSGTSGVVVTTPTSVNHGVVGRWAVAAGGGAIWFISRDGLYITTGGEAVNVSDPDVRPLFEGETVRGYLPIDFSNHQALRVTYHDNDVYMLYGNSIGQHHVLVYSAVFKYWRQYRYVNQPGVLYADEGRM